MSKPSVNKRSKKLKKYLVYGAVSGGKFLGRFEATSKEKALEKAEMSEENDVSLCHQCDRECENAEIHDYEVIEEEEDE